MSARVTELWLVRHGQTGSNAAGRIQGQSDSPLTALGRDQAARLAGWLQARPQLRFGAVVTSPLRRARDTAEPLARAVGAPLFADPGLMERSFGDWEGRVSADVYAAQDAAPGDPFDFAPPGGEATRALAERVFACVDAWLDRDDVGERLLVVTHGGPIAALGCRALGIPYSRAGIRSFRRDNTGVTVLQRRAGSLTGFAVAQLNGRLHLD